MKFAKIDFIQNIEEIPLKFNLHKNDKILNWYIRKFTPYLKEEVNILGISGYKIKIPIQKKFAYENYDLLFELYKKTINSINQLNVEIVDVPYDFKNILHSEITTTNRQTLFISFMLQIILKVIKIINVDLKKLQIVILDGDKQLTKLVIKEIYENINYLTIITKNDYTELLQEIFYDNGLNIVQVESSNSIMATADIVINLDDEDFKNYHILKRGSAFIDLSNNVKSILNVCIKREDVLVIDNFNVNFENKVYSLEELELAYYVKSSNYRTIKNANNKKMHINKINDELNHLGVTLNSFKRLNKTLNTMYYTKLKQK